MTRRKLVAILVAVVVPGGLATATAAQTQPTLTVSPSSAAPGSSVDATGARFDTSTTAALFLDTVVPGEELAVTPVTRGGFSARFTVPDVAPGGHRVIACGEPDGRGGCRQQASAPLTVLEGPRPTSTTTTAPASTTTTSGLSVTTTSSTTTTTSPPIGVSTTTAPPTTTTPGQLAGSTTTSTAATGLAVTTTTVGGFPPFTGTTLPLGATTTFSVPTPGAVAGDNAESIPNLAITHLEVTQGLQNLDNAFPLVRHRVTYLRIHGTSESEGPFGQTGVMAAVEGVRNGQSLGIEYAENTPVHWDGSLVRISNDYAPYVLLPSSWTTGTVTLRAWVWAVDPTAGNEPTAADNLAEVTVVFRLASPLPHLWYFPLYLTEDYSPGGTPAIHTVADGYLQQHLHAGRLLPVPVLFAHPQATVVGTAASEWDLSEDGDKGAPLDALAALHELNDAAANDIYVGMVDPDLDTAPFTGLASGAAPVFWGKMFAGFNNAWPWHNRGGATIAHEVGHNYGLQHAPCEVEDGDPIPGEVSGGAVDPTFPGAYGFPDCSLAPEDPEGFYGFDVGWPLTDADEPSIMTNKNEVSAPFVAYPWMGYRSPKWLDPWHGCQFLTALGVPCTQTDLVPIPPGAPNNGSIPTPPPGGGHGIAKIHCHDVLTDIDLCQFLPPGTNDPIQATGEVPLVPPPGWEPPFGRMVITGRITTADESDADESDADDGGAGDGGAGAGAAVGHLAAALRLPGDPLPATHPLDADPTGGGPFVLALVDAEGVARWATRVRVAGGGAHGSHGEGGSGAPGPQPFAVTVPNLPETVRIILASPQGVLAELVPSPAAPLVAIEGVELSDDLVVRLAAGDPDGDQLTTAVQWHPGGDGAWQTIAVDAAGPELHVPLADLVGSEGGTVRLVVSDGFHSATAEVGGVVVPAQPPSVAITSPHDGASRPAGRTLDLRAQAVLPGGAVLDGEALVWSSDRDGALGTGELLAVDSLAVGTHRLEVTATSPAGPTASDAITVEITESDLPSAEEQALVSAALAGQFVGDDGDGGGGRWGAIGFGGLGVGALALAGVASLRARRRRSKLAAAFGE